VWGYPVLPAVFIVSTAVIVINQIVAQPVESATGLLFVLLGLPVYYIWARNHAEKNNAARSQSS
jgi:APA family basic amino acid/polyamine antiporter